MAHNPITEEIREIRHRLAAQFDNDVRRIGAETRRRQAASGRKVIRLPRNQPLVAVMPSLSAPARDQTEPSPN